MRNNFETESEFNHLEVDVEKGIFKIDGQEVKRCSYLHIYFENGSWGMYLTQDISVKQKSVSNKETLERTS